MEWKDYNTCGHKLLTYRLGYLAHHAEMDRRAAKGQKQKQCKKCGLWIYKDEQPTSPEFVNKKSL